MLPFGTHGQPRRLSRQPRVPITQSESRQHGRTARDHHFASDIQILSTGHSWPHRRTIDLIEIMTSPTSDDEAALVKSSWFTRPLAGWACVLGWCVATGVFVAGIVVPGGTAVGDAYLIIYPTWAVSHGQFVCMYPPHPASVASLAAPVYPLIAGAAGFVTRIGSSTSFPTGSALGRNCDKAVVGMVQWSERAGAVFPTLRIGYLAWIFLMVGVIMLLRSAGRGRTGWEPTGVVIVACLPPLWYCIEMYAHPQDVVAMAFGLAAVACALRSRWVAAGVLVMLAILTQQYALLIAIPLFVVAPAARKLPFVIGGALTAAVVALPLVAATSGAAVRPIFLGTGNVGGIGGTIAWEAHIRTGATLFLGSRVPPSCWR